MFLNISRQPHSCLMDRIFITYILQKISLVLGRKQNSTNNPHTQTSYNTLLIIILANTGTLENSP